MGTCVDRQTQKSIFDFLYLAHGNRYTPVFASRRPWARHLSRNYPRTHSIDFSLDVDEDVDACQLPCEYCENIYPMGGHRDMSILCGILRI